MVIYMKERYIAPAVMLIAGVVMSVLNILNHETLLTGLERLLFVLIVFYIIGKIATAIIRKFTKAVIPDEIIENDKSEETDELKKEQNFEEE